MAKVFLDIGAHLGETLQVTRLQRWGFDRIVCFEPAPNCWPFIESLADERVELCRFGLWSSDSTMTLYDPGAVGASLFESKRISDSSVEVELRDAVAWFRDQVAPEDEVIMKVNCEGAECELLDHLLASGELSKVNELLVHFDVRKVDGMHGREAITRRALDAARVPYRAAEEIFFGRNIPEKTANWLSWYHASRLKKPFYSVVRRVEFAIRVPVYRLRNRGRG